MNKNILSIIVPTYKSNAFINESLDLNHELIIDDGGSDKTSFQAIEFIESFKTSKINFVFLRHLKNLG